MERPEELERIEGHLSYPMFRDLRQRNQVFSGPLARQAAPVSLVSTGRTERSVAELVSGNYFSVLGVQARPWAAPSPMLTMRANRPSAGRAQLSFIGAGDSPSIQPSWARRSASIAILSG